MWHRQPNGVTDNLSPPYADVEKYYKGIHGGGVGLLLGAYRFQRGRFCCT